MHYLSRKESSLRGVNEPEAYPRSIPGFPADRREENLRVITKVGRSRARARAWLGLNRYHLRLTVARALSTRPALPSARHKSPCRKAEARFAGSVKSFPQTR